MCCCLIICAGPPKRIHHASRAVSSNSADAPCSGGSQEAASLDTFFPVHLDWTLDFGTPALDRSSPNIGAINTPADGLYDTEKYL